jgi:hypothetical protein
VSCCVVCCAWLSALVEERVPVLFSQRIPACRQVVSDPHVRCDHCGSRESMDTKVAEFSKFVDGMLKLVPEQMYKGYLQQFYAQEEEEAEAKRQEEMKQQQQRQQQQAKAREAQQAQFARQQAGSRGPQQMMYGGGGGAGGSPFPSTSPYGRGGGMMGRGGTSPSRGGATFGGGFGGGTVRPASRGPQLYYQSSPSAASEENAEEETSNKSGRAHRHQEQHRNGNQCNEHIINRSLTNFIELFPSAGHLQSCTANPIANSTHFNDMNSILSHRNVRSANHSLEPSVAGTSDTREMTSTESAAAVNLDPGRTRTRSFHGSSNALFAEESKLQSAVKLEKGSFRIAEELGQRHRGQECSTRREELDLEPRLPPTAAHRIRAATGATVLGYQCSILLFDHVLRIGTHERPMVRRECMRHHGP